MKWDDKGVEILGTLTLLMSLSGLDLKYRFNFRCQPYRRNSTETRQIFFFYEFFVYEVVLFLCFKNPSLCLKSQFLDYLNVVNGDDQRFLTETSALELFFPLVFEFLL